MPSDQTKTYITKDGFLKVHKKTPSVSSPSSAKSVFSNKSANSSTSSLSTSPPSHKYKHKSGKLARTDDSLVPLPPKIKDPKRRPGQLLLSPIGPPPSSAGSVSGSSMAGSTRSDISLEEALDALWLHGYEIPTLKKRVARKPKCQYCEKSFDSEKTRDAHEKYYSSCLQHKECFPDDEWYYHVINSGHTHKKCPRWRCQHLPAFKTEGDFLKHYLVKHQ